MSYQQCSKQTNCGTSIEWNTGQQKEQTVDRCVRELEDSILFLGMTNNVAVNVCKSLDRHTFSLGLK